MHPPWCIVGLLSLHVALLNMELIVSFLPRPFAVVATPPPPTFRLLQLQRQAPPLAPHEARPVERSNERVLHAEEMETEGGTNGYIFRHLCVLLLS